jgi:hypothetical protein
MNPQPFVARGKCSTCGYTFEMCSSLTGTSGPQAGDYTLCIECGEIFQFGPEMELRPTRYRNRLLRRAQKFIRSPWAKAWRDAIRKAGSQ